MGMLKALFYWILFDGTMESGLKGLAVSLLAPFHTFSEQVWTARVLDSCDCFTSVCGFLAFYALFRLLSHSKERMIGVYWSRRG